MSHKKSKSGKAGIATRAGLLKKLCADGRWGEAQQLAMRMLAENPSDSDALKASAEYSLGSGDYQTAARLCERLVAVRPESVWAQMNLGVCLARMRRVDEAKVHLHEAERLRPGDPDVCGNLSSLYFVFQDYERSLEYADKAVAGAPENPSAHNSRGAALLKLDRYQEALLALAKAIDLYPGDYYEDAVENLGLTLHDSMRYAEAFACYEQILLHNPDDVGSLALLMHSALQVCEWDGFEERVKRLSKYLKDGRLPDGIPPFVFLSVPGLSGADHRRLTEHAATTILAVEVEEPPAVDRLPALMHAHERIRIGYLSADLHAHATAQLVVEVLELHDRSRFEVYAYSYGPDDQSPMRSRVVRACEHFVELRDVPLNLAIEQIRNDQIDILVDLKGWTHGVRLELSAMRPAPIVVSWLGYPGTLGVPGLADYIIGDPYVTPLSHSSDYSECIVQLPHSYQPNDRRREVAPMPSRGELGLPEQGVVYCSFNQSYKINRPYFSAWCEILRRVPGSVLWLLEPDALAATNLRKELAKMGIAPDRLIFAPRRPLDEHLGRLQQASIALDTAPYGSHTTGSDTLWVGVPLVTTPGDTFASRVAASLLAAAGVPELIAQTMDDYVELAVRLGTHPEELSALRQRIRDQRMSCPLFDSSRFTRSLEAAYDQIVYDARHGVRAPVILED